MSQPAQSQEPADHQPDDSRSRPAAGDGQRPAQVPRRHAVWFNPDLRSRNYFVPGVAANILLMVTLMLTAQAIIREKEIGTMEQLMVTPLRPIELMLGKTIPFAIVGMINMVIVTVAAIVIFRIPFRGSFLCCCSAPRCS
jgi:ABC-2 type transport system permease protein